MSRIGILAPVRVVSHSVVRRPVEPPSPVPDAGRAWGSASKFDYSLQAQDQSADIVEGGDEGGDGSGSVNVRWVRKRRYVLGVEQFRDASVEAVAVGDDLLEVEGIRSVTFYTGTRKIRHEERKVTGSYTSVTPTIEHRKEFLRLVFPFESARVRGTPAPADTPPLPNLDDVYGG